MPIHTNLQQARASLPALCNAVGNGGETVIIRRAGGDDVAPIPAAELRSLRETAHLLRSPRNAERLLRAMLRAIQRPGQHPDGSEGSR